MEVMGSLLLLGGFLLSIVSQVLISIKAFKRTFIEGILCILLPGYVIFCARRQETRQLAALVLWGSGIILLIIGVAILS